MKMINILLGFVNLIIGAMQVPIIIFFLIGTGTNIVTFIVLLSCILFIISGFLIVMNSQKGWYLSLGIMGLYILFSIFEVINHFPGEWFRIFSLNFMFFPPENMLLILIFALIEVVVIFYPREKLNKPI